MAAPLTNNAAPPVHTQAQNPKDLRVALLTNSLSPHSLPLWECLSTGVKQFRALVSAGFDLQHKFPKATTHLDVKLQRSFNRFRFHNKPYGTWESDDFHLPYDTYHQRHHLRAVWPSHFTLCSLWPHASGGQGHPVGHALLPQ
jgi:hypothetical protein